MSDLVYLLRHAAPPSHRLGRFWGRADPGVDEGSLAAAGALSALPWLRPGRLVSSPLPRAALTAGRLAGGLGLAVETAPDLAEVDFGAFDGMTYDEICFHHPAKAEEWERLRDGFAFPEGESIGDFFARATRAWKWCQALPDPVVLAVAHGGIIAAWLCLFLGLPFERRFAFRAGHSALTALVRKRDGSGWDLAFFNQGAV